MVESTEQRSSGTATTSFAYRTASLSGAEFGRCIRVRAGSEAAANSVGYRPAVGFLGWFPSAAEAAFTSEDYAREAAG